MANPTISIYKLYKLKKKRKKGTRKLKDSRHSFTIILFPIHLAI